VNSFGLQDFAKGFCHIKNLEISWASLDFIIREIMKEEFEDGKYVLYRDPGKRKLTLYSVDDKEFDEKPSDDNDPY